MVQVGLAELIEHPLLMLEVQRSIPAPSENTTFTPKPKVSLLSSRAHCRISKLSEGGTFSTLTRMSVISLKYIGF